MKKKLFVFDLDGTLLTDDKNTGGLSNEFRKFIDEIKNIGHIPVIITGRPWYSSKEIYEYNNFNTIIGNNNGAYIHFPNNDSFNPITIMHEKEFVKKIMNDNIVRKVSNNIVLELIEMSYLEKIENSFLGELLELEDRRKYTSPIDTSKIDKNVMTIIIEIKKEEEENIEEIFAYLDKTFGDDSSVTSWVSFDKEAKIIEISPPEGRKDYALTTIANYYGISIENTYAFGDGINDLHMLELAGHGVAMINGHENVKKIADDVTELPNSEFGVIEYIKKHHLLKV